jgi:hypothetical protein
MDGEAVEIDERLDEADLFVMGEYRVQKAARAIAQRLDEQGIGYAVAGALAVAAHGHTRLTVDVGLLVTAEGLAAFKRAWLGRGYAETFPGSRSVRDTENDVRIDFILSGEFPGDGKPKPVSFPDPAVASSVGPRYRVLALPRLIEIKLASGMSAAHRLQDLADASINVGDEGDPDHPDLVTLGDGQVWLVSRVVDCPGGTDTPDLTLVAVDPVTAGPVRRSRRTAPISSPRGGRAATPMRPVRSTSPSSTRPGVARAGGRISGDPPRDLGQQVVVSNAAGYGVAWFVFGPSASGLEFVELYDDGAPLRDGPWRFPGVGSTRGRPALARFARVVLRARRGRQHPALAPAPQPRCRRVLQPRHHMGRDRLPALLRVRVERALGHARAPRPLHVLLRVHAVTVA